MPAWPEPDAAWYEATNSRRSPNSRCSAASGTMSDSVVQFGTEMMPLGRLFAASGLTSGTTSGTSGSIRNAPDLSITTAPRDAATGAQSTETSSGTSIITRSTPSNTSGVMAWTSTSSPLTRSRRPADRAEAISRISLQMSSLVDRTSSMTVPTAPVAPTTARTGRRPRPPAGAAPAPGPALTGRSRRRRPLPRPRRRGRRPGGSR